MGGEGPAADLSKGEGGRPITPEGHIKGALLQNIQLFGPCGHIRRTLLQNILIFWPLRAY